MEITMLAPAKINLTLDITGRREDGYHLIHTIMQAVDYTDEVRVSLREAGGIRLTVSDPTLPADARNTAYRAAAAFLATVDLEEALPGVDIHVTKRIPMEAGLAGGSADAAAVLTALNWLTDAHMTAEELCEIGQTVGADVPFCILGGAAAATGIGTILSPLPFLPACWLVIAKPDCGVSTAEAYRLVDGADIPHRPHQFAMTDALCGGDLEAAGRELCNVFEYALDLPEVRDIKAVMRRHGTLGCQMTGSGSAVFGLFSDKGDARRCADALREGGVSVHVCRPCESGPFPA